ncbi:hypothetical protein [Mesorhizobium sp. B263B2A]|uniref:hypothetical protein n=1 Tax=Mesorhizobium sp. B263B2A TaxID=2876669 RepID=UPI001CD0EAC1|nr:hypothetical protein [Mesorhizobium sp. B263B2A]MCA0032714.1 hypothetical protein [Mesorhizobium sp. B263B2A]
MLKDILARIESRLNAVGLKESAAAVMAGLSDSAIRDMRRAIRDGKDDAGVSTRTLVKLAPVLETTASWLMEGTGPEQSVMRSPDEILAVLHRIDGLKPENVGVLLSMIDGFQRANAASQPRPALPDGRSEPATSRREASPSP